MQGLGINTSIEQKQVLHINNAQLQKIEILQMNSIELEERIREEIMENPVLEISDTASSDNHSSESSEESCSQSDQLDHNSGDEYDDHDYWDYDHKLGSGNSYSFDVNMSNGISEFENFYRTDETLGEHLLNQLGTTRCSDTIKRAAGYIIFSLRNDGYLDISLGEIADMAKCSEEDAETALDIVQSFDPVGVGARTLEECLCLQLDPEDDLTEDATIIIQQHLREIAGGKIKAITEAKKIGAERLIRIIELIKRLDPKPGSRFADNIPIQYMHPDVYASIEDGEVETWLENQHPQLCVSTYYSSLARTASDASVAEYLKERIESATALIRNIEQRNTTVLKVSLEILNRQRNFFELGEMAIKPLTMQDIADELEISVSTVSRAVSGKNVHCNGKTYPLKKFFVSEVAGVAKDSVQERIKELIEGEDKRHPLSDREITEMLSEENIEISRRTVAKYREAAGILSTSMRRIR